MLVKAKWNVKDASGWHSAGEEFETNADMGDAVEVILNSAEIAEPVNAPEPEKEPEPAKEEAKAEKPRTSPRRKTVR